MRWWSRFILVMCLLILGSHTEISGGFLGVDGRKAPNGSMASALAVKCASKKVKQHSCNYISGMENATVSDDKRVVPTGPNPLHNSFSRTRVQGWALTCSSPFEVLSSLSLPRPLQNETNAMSHFSKSSEIIREAGPPGPGCSVVDLVVEIYKDSLQTEKGCIGLCEQQKTENTPFSLSSGQDHQTSDDSLASQKMSQPSLPVYTSLTLEHKCTGEANHEISYTYI
ncbi:hypothetical protein H6P81_010668 [Aristolochia fimbriata]|uniref:Uncharacterized protein n=1 Tax=Aristolochia fimbriata TaxID=158543 RepID=A0AAV7EPN1_ARIFI|nr:hypothetical protein H6P81_010668 [Aristolochia fimbriata]